MKKFVIGLLFSMFVLFGLFIMIKTPYVEAITDDVNYTFQEDIIFEDNTGNYTLDSYFNIRNRTYSTLEYNATYSFEDEVGSFGTDIDFVDTDNSGSGCTASVESNIYNHNKILDLNDTSSSSKSEVINLLDSTQEFGTIEYWYLITDKTKYFYIYLMDGDGDSVQTIVWNAGLNAWRYKDGAGWYDIPNIENPVNNIWTHVTIHFEGTSGGYKDLEENEWKIIHNGIDSGELGYRTNDKDVDKILLRTHESGSDYHYYLDAIGFSWDSGYNIGDNILPCIYEDSTSLEIHRYEFAYNTTGESNEIEGSDFINWEEIEVGGYDNVYISSDETTDRAVSIENKGTTGNFGIKREDFNIQYASDIVFDFYLKYLSMANADSYYYINLYSYGSSLLTRLRILEEAGNINLYYYDGSYHLIEQLLHSGSVDYNFSLVIRNNHWCTLNMIDGQSGGNNGTYFFPLNNDEDGLSKIEFYGNMPDTSDDNIIVVDYFGVYINGSSISDDFGYIDYNIYNDGCGAWNSENSNLFYFNASGSFSLNTYHASYQWGLIPFMVHNNTLEFYNIYGLFDYQTIFTPHLLIVTNTTGNFAINYIKISGVILKQSSREYNLVFDYNNVNITENYFYVVSNRLYFRLDINDSSIEYIQASFDIKDEMCRNGTISFNSYYIGYNTPYFDIQFSDGNYYYYPMSYAGISQRFILPQEYVIDKFVFNISDYLYDNETNNLSSGYIQGYITDVSLLFVWDIDLTLTIGALITGIIPLLVILLPTFSVSAIFREQGNKAILPMLIIMSLICYVGEIIPLWLFGSLMVNYGLLFIINRKGEIYE